MAIGAVNGAAVGFALGPAAEKGATILSGFFANAVLLHRKFYFRGGVDGSTKGLTGAEQVCTTETAWHIGCKEVGFGQPAHAQDL